MQLAFPFLLDILPFFGSAKSVKNIYSVITGGKAFYEVGTSALSICAGHFAELAGV